MAVSESIQSSSILRRPIMPLINETNLTPDEARRVAAAHEALAESYYTAADLAETMVQELTNMGYSALYPKIVRETGNQRFLVRVEGRSDVEVQPEND